MDAAELRPLTSSLSEGVVIYDKDGLTLDLNRAFSDLVGFNMAEGPLRPPYPWWPTTDEDAEVREELERLHQRWNSGEDVALETTFYDNNRKPVPVSLTAGPIGSGGAGAARFEVVSSLKAARNARSRRAAAAEVSKDLASIDDLDTLLGVAEHGFSLLFDGGSTIQVGVGEHARWFSAGVPMTAENLTAEVAAGLGGEPSPDTTSLRPGILLAPQSSVEGCRAWIQFTPPRRISADEMIVADLFAQAFSIAVDRLVQAERAADRETQLQRAVESHRLIGEAVGILVERHKCLPSEAFARLRAASQNRNVKLRDVAAHVIETGLDPDEA